MSPFDANAEPAGSLVGGAWSGIELTRGAARLLRDLGHGVLTEFRLKSGRRVDAIGVDQKGCITVVEVKSGTADFRTDAKWPDYREYCDAFYFAVPAAFPHELIPDDCGLMVVDHWGGEVVRTAPTHALSGARRKAMLVRFAMAAAGRHQALLDPATSAGTVW